MRKNLYQPYLSIYVVWHPEFEDGAYFADRIFGRFNRDMSRPLAPGPGVPVFYRTKEAGRGCPAPLDTVGERHTVIIMLVDDAMTASDDSDDWAAYAGDILALREAAPDRVRFYPVSLSEYAYFFDEKVSALNFIRLQALEGRELQGDALLTSLTHEISRLLTAVPVRGLEEGELSYEPVRLFISHAKQDGEDLALALKNYIENNASVKTFFDVNDIAAGHAFGDEIEGNIERSALLVIRTDAYHTREWCRREVLAARRFNCPITVLDAVKDGEIRSFPYLTNVPVLRYDSKDPRSLYRAFDAAMLENLRKQYIEGHLRSLGRLYGLPEDTEYLFRAPDLLTLHHLKRRRPGKKLLVIYPDPPLGGEEQVLLEEFSEEISLCTPNDFSAQGVFHD